MLFNLTDILANENPVTQSLDCGLEAPFFKIGKAQYKVLQNGPVHLQMDNPQKGQVHITGTGDFKLLAKCDRCLATTEVDVSIAIDEKVKKESLTDATDPDETPFITGFDLDTEALISGEILISWPGKILCKEDCKGICTKCGKDLNQADCGCDTFVPDPRMAVLSDIFNANKEV